MNHDRVSINRRFDRKTARRKFGCKKYNSKQSKLVLFLTGGAYFFAQKDIYFSSNGGSRMAIAAGRHPAVTATAFGILALASSSLQVPLQASTIISITSITGNESGGLAVEGGSQVVAQGWSTSTVYQDVSITADLDTVSPTGADLIAYLMTQIGPGTTTSSQLAFSPGVVITGSSPATYTLFSGLTLDPGTYYLVLSTASSPVANWVGPSPPSTGLITTATGVAYIGQFDACDQPFLTCNAYAPASTFRSGPNLTIFAVATPEPSTGALAGMCLVAAMLLRRRKRP